MRLDPLDYLKDGKMWVLLVGVNQYQDVRLPPLLYAVSDCDGLAQALQGALPTPNALQETIGHYGTFKTDQLRDEIYDSLDRLAEEAKSNDTVIVYLSGHGELDRASGRLYVCLSETNLDQLSETGLSIQHLLTQLETCRARKQVLIIDACHSGQLAGRPRSANATLTRSATHSQKEPDPEFTSRLDAALHQCSSAQTTKDFCAFLSCSAAEQSYEYSAYENSCQGGGVFTHFLIRGIRGEAADFQDCITLNSLETYVKKNTYDYVWHRESASQTPRLVSNKGQEIVIGVRSSFSFCVTEQEKAKPFSVRRDIFNNKVREVISSEYPLELAMLVQLKKYGEDLRLRQPDREEIVEREIKHFESDLDCHFEKVRDFLLKHDPQRRNEISWTQLRAGFSSKTNIVEKLQEQEQKAIAFVDEQIKVYQSTFRERLRQHVEPDLEAILSSLKSLQDNLELGESVVRSIATIELNAYRQNKQQYEDAVRAKYYQDIPIDLDLARNLKLAPSVAEQITNAIKQQFNQDKQAYAKLYADCLHEFGLITPEVQQQLDAMQRDRGFNDAVVAVIIAPEKQKFQQHKQTYKTEYDNAIRRNYLLKGEVGEKLSDTQKRLDLGDLVTDEIKREIIEAYKLDERTYSSEFLNEIFKCPLSNDQLAAFEKRRDELRLWDTTEIQQLEEQERERLEQKVEQYRQAFDAALRQDDLHPETRLRIQKQLGQPVLGDYYILPIEKELKDVFGRDKHNYKQAYLQARSQEDTLTDDSEQRLRELQLEFRFSDTLTKAIEDEADLLLKQEIIQPPAASNASENAQDLIQESTEKDEPRQPPLDPADVAEEYRKLVQEAIARQCPLSPSDREHLNMFRLTFGLSDEVADAIEQEVIRAYEGEELPPPLLLPPDDTSQPEENSGQAPVEEREEPVSKPKPLFVGSIVAVLAGAIALGGYLALFRQPTANHLNKLQSADEMVLAQVKQSTSSQNPETLKTAIALAQLLPQNETAKELMGEALLAQANLLAKDSKYANAIALLQQISEGTSAFSQVQTNTNKWSEEIFKVAQTSHGKGDLQVAIDIAATVPNQAANYQEVVEAIEQWRTEKTTLIQIKDARSQGNWQLALQKIEQLRNVPYRNTKIEGWDFTIQEINAWASQRKAAYLENQSNRQRQRMQESSTSGSNSGNTRSSGNATNSSGRNSGSRTSGTRQQEPYKPPMGRPIR